VRVDGYRIAVCPGTYDPVTNGHVDIIERAARLFDELVVSVTTGSEKKLPLFDAEERIAMVEQSVAHLDNVRVEGFNSLIIEHARDLGASVLVKGLRAISDFDYEFQMAQLNRHLAAEIETVYLPASSRYSFISSSGVREVAAWGGAVDDWVPVHVAHALRARHRRGPDSVP
jgi:pantetheine-phosphate adenylyltransferase